jgi:putative redox protein
MQNLRVDFDNEAGERLSGILDLPAATVQAYALFAHCFTCSKNLKAATNISRALTDAGIAVLRFDFTGLGQSEGEFSDTNFSSNVSDLLAAVAFLDTNYAAPAILLGHSLGGTAVLQAAENIPSAVAVATIGSPSEPSHVARMFASARDDLDEKGFAEVSLGGRPFTVRQQFLEDLQLHDLPQTIGALRKALLIMHAPLDDVVEVDNAGALFAAAKHPKSFVSLDKADHLLSHSEDSLYAGRVLAAWASRYLPVAEDTAALVAGTGEVVARSYIDSFRTDVRAGKHHLVADEPTSVGGTDQGPTPYDLLAAALATCTTMTLKMYASFKKLGLRSTTVRVSHDKIHAEDCADCESTTGKIDEFRRELSFDGELSEKEIARLLEIADRCPVHKTLHGEIKVRTTLA